MLRYLKVMGYPIPRDPKTKKPTTGEMELALLADRLEREGHPDPLFSDILCGRKLKKGRGYLLDNFLGRDGRMHPEFTLLPETGRLSSRRPSFMNQPQGRAPEGAPPWELIEKEVAKAIRSTVIPTPGFLLMEADWISMEAQLLAWFANDPSYARISTLGAHAYLMSHIIGKPADLAWDDKKLKAYLKEVKESDAKAYHTAKTSNLSDTYDVGVRKLAKVLNCSLSRAQEIKDIRRRAFPLIAEWQLRTRLRAHHEGKLVNPFGFPMYFWNVFEPVTKPRRDGKKFTLGQQAHECLAGMPQSTNASMLRQVIVEFADLKLDWMFLLVPIHDALFVEVREDMVDEGRKVLRNLMGRPWKELDGLRVGVDIKVGTNWAKMEQEGE